MFDYNKCRLVFKVDGKTVLDQEYVRQGGRPYRYEYPLEWAVGDHQLAVELIPLTPKEKQLRVVDYTRCRRHQCVGCRWNKEYAGCRRKPITSGISLTRFPPALQKDKFTRAGCSSDLPPKLSGTPSTRQR